MSDHKSDFKLAFKESLELFILSCILLLLLLDTKRLERLIVQLITEHIEL